MPAPRRPRTTQPPKRKEPALTPLGGLILEHERWLRSLPGKASRGALRDHWQKLDAQHSQRPDYLLWREIESTDSQPAKRHDVVDLTLRCLRAPEATIRWAALTLLPDIMERPSVLASPKYGALLQTLKEALNRESKIPATAPSETLIRWLALRFLEPAQASSWTELQALIQSTQTDWKLGRKIDLNFWDTDPPWPLSRPQMMRRLAMSIHRQVKAHTLENRSTAIDLAPWHLSAWMLLRDARPAHKPAGVIELETLLAAATTARLAEDLDQWGRLTALALNQLPAQLPEALIQRCRVAAWNLSETGLECPPLFKTIFDDLPFPGELPATEMGRTAAQQYLDESDIANLHLTDEVQNESTWEVLRQHPIVLHHPLAALSWVSRKAQAYALKKQQALLQAAATLATRHRRLTTLGRLLPHLPASADQVLDYARLIRENQRQMPFLRDQEIWLDWTRSLKAAWARLEPETIQDPEQVFLLHETLHDREVTLLRSLPHDLRVLALRHWHSRKHPSPLVHSLIADPRLMQQLEHQRQVELWSIATELRERADLASMVWLSLVMRGDPAQGRYSLIIQGPKGRVIHQDRLRANDKELDWGPLLEIISRAIPEVNPNATQLLAAIDPVIQELPWNTWLRQEGAITSISFIPSWEWAFRVLRESAPSSPYPGHWLAPETSKAEAPEGVFLQPLPPHTCVLLPSDKPCNADTRWLTLEAPDTPPQRSLQIGTYDRIISGSPFRPCTLKQDLVRLSLSHSTRSFSTPLHPLNEVESFAFNKAPLVNPETWIRFGL